MTPKPGCFIPRCIVAPCPEICPEETPAANPESPAMLRSKGSIVPLVLISAAVLLVMFFIFSND